MLTTLKKKNQNLPLTLEMKSWKADKQEIKIKKSLNYPILKFHHSKTTKIFKVNDHLLLKTHVLLIIKEKIVNQMTVMKAVINLYINICKKM